jgi:hypothetical protein
VLDQMGLATALETLAGYAERFGARYAPPALLKAMASEGKRFFR